MEITLQRENDIPLYRQIVEQIQSQILGCKLTPGLRLPPVRELADRLEVSVPTALRAYSELKELGLIGSAVGSGTYVADPSTRWAGVELLKTIRVQGPLNLYEPLSSQTGIRSLATAVGDPKLFHSDDFIAELRDAGAASPWNFYYAPPAGVGELLREGSALLAQRGLVPQEDELMVGPGARAAIGLVLQALSSPGDSVLLECPAYLGAPTNLPSLHLNMVFVPVDAGGTLDLELAEAAIVREKPKFMILQPAFGNCIGQVWSDEKANRLVALVRRHGITLIEWDDACRLTYRSEPPSPLVLKLREAGHGVYVESLDDSLSPALRTSFIWSNSSIRNRILYYSRSIDPASPLFHQLAVARLLAKGGLRAHQRRVLPRLAVQRDAMVSALRREMPREVRWREPQGGYSVWLDLPENARGGGLYEESLEAGVGFAPGWMFHNNPDAARSLRLSFGISSPETIREAVAILSRIIRARLA